MVGRRHMTSTSQASSESTQASCTFSLQWRAQGFALPRARESGVRKYQIDRQNHSARLLSREGSGFLPPCRFM